MKTKEYTDHFIRLIKNKSFNPTPKQEKFIRTIIQSAKDNNMVGALTGKTTLFKWIDNFLTYNKLEI